MSLVQLILLIIVVALVVVGIIRKDWIIVVVGVAIALVGGVGTIR